MRGVSFTKDDRDGSGVIAQELEKIAPELVHTSDDEMGTKSVAYGNLVGYLIENAKEQQKEIDELKTLVKQLLEK
jgi:ABC-type Fe3+-citrate transport system substrate-binding protein